MKYFSFFSGIGGFEFAMRKEVPEAHCIGFSEIDKRALSVYTKHYPSHVNWGDITKIDSTEFAKHIRKQACGMIVGGFPCTNLSSQANLRGNNKGIDGPQSGLVRPFCKLIKAAIKVNPELDFVIENNASMRHIEKKRITRIIKSLTKRKVYVTELNAASFGMQQRRRIFWTTFPILSIPNVQPSWSKILLPLKEARQFACEDTFVKSYLNSTNTKRKSPTKTTTKAVGVSTTTWKLVTVKSTLHSRFHMNFLHDTNMKRSRPILCSSTNTIILDRRPKRGVLIRKLSTTELERLFHFPDGYVRDVSFNSSVKLLGNSVNVGVIRHIAKSWKQSRK